MVPVVGLFRCPGACPDLGAFFRGIFWGHIGGHVEQNSVCRDTNAVDERNQPHLVFWLYFIIFLQYLPLFFRISLPPWGGACPVGGAVGYCVPFGWSGLFRCLGAQRPVGRLPGGGPRFSRETGERGPGPSVIDRRFRRKPSQGVPCHVGSRPVPGGGSRHSLRESPDAKSRGGGPPPPHSMARSFPLARFGVVGRSGAVVGLFRGSSTCPDLGAFFFRISSGTQTKTAPVKCTGAGQNSIINFDPAHIPQRLPTNSAGFHITY